MFVDCNVKQSWLYFSPLNFYWPIFFVCIKHDLQKQFQFILHKFVIVNKKITYFLKNRNNYETSDISLNKKKLDELYRSKNDKNRKKKTRFCWTIHLDNLLLCSANSDCGVVSWLRECGLSRKWMEDWTAGLEFASRNFGSDWDACVE